MMTVHRTENFSHLALMGLFEKRRFRNLLIWINDYDEKDPKTYKDIPPNTRMIDAFKKFGLDQDTIDFTGHALALHSDDEYEKCLVFSFFFATFSRL